MTLITLTIGDQAENHRGMEKLGKLANKGDGFNIDDMQKVINLYPNNCNIKYLNNINDVIDKLPEAYVLIIRNGVNLIGGKLYDDKMMNEQLKQNWDKKALMYGKNMQ